MHAAQLDQSDQVTEQTEQRKHSARVISVLSGTEQLSMLSKARSL